MQPKHTKPKKRSAPRRQSKPSPADQLELEQPGPAEQPAPAKAKPASGWAKIQAAGKRAIMLAVTPEEYAKFEEAAKADRRAISAWVVHAALQQLRFCISEN